MIRAASTARIVDVVDDFNGVVAASALARRSKVHFKEMMELQGHVTKTWRQDSLK